MGFHYKINPSSKLINVTWAGPFSLKQVNANLNQLYSDAHYDPSYRGLCDSRTADFKFTADESTANQQFVANHPNKPTGPWAVLCAEPLQTAYAMMYESFPNPSHETRVFCTEEAAMEWLDSQK